MPEAETDIRDTLQRVSRILQRRRWWIMVTAPAITLATIAALQFVPDRYTSTATLVVVQQQIPARYVVPNSVTDPTSALEAMKQEVLSRTRLTDMINDFGLYPKERAHVAPEQLVTMMLKDIDIVPFGSAQQKDFDGFKISFTSQDSVLAQRVTTTLTSLFINENLRTREQQSTNTTKFLHEQLDAKRKKLEEQEDQLRDFKLHHIGELPEQQQGNLGILTGLQNQLQGTMTALNRAQQQRVYLQSLLDAYRKQPAVMSSAPLGGSAGGTRPPSAVAIAQSELARLESARAGLLAKYTPEHPDIRKLNREIARTEENIRQLRGAGSGKSEETSTSAAAAPRSVDPANGEEVAAAQFRSQLDANRLEIDNLAKDEQRLKSLISQYENRLNQTPIREQQQGGIVRETEALRQEYAELQKKEQESQLATNLEKQQGGEQFRLIDAASLPLLPSSPKRLKISLFGLVGGFVLGLALALFREMSDTSLHTEQDVKQHLAPPFVVAVPLLPTRAEERRGWRRAVGGWVAQSALVLIVLVAEFYVYKRG